MKSMTTFKLELTMFEIGMFLGMCGGQQYKEAQLLYEKVLQAYKNEMEKEVTK